MKNVISKRLILNKSTVANLDKNSLGGVWGGIVYTEGPRCKSEATCPGTMCCPTENCTGGCPRTDTAMCPNTYDINCYSNVCTSNPC